MKQQLMTLLLGAASVFCSCETQLEQHVKSELRAPAYPLVSIDPYTSAWSFTTTYTTVRSNIGAVKISL